VTRAVPGACLAGVWPALAALALAFNVFFLRVHQPGLVSGKLSDLAINFLLPLVLVAAVEWLLAAGGRFRPLGVAARVALCGVSALYFTLLQLVPSFVQVHSALLGLLDLPFGGERSFSRNVADAADLLTLVATGLAALVLCRWRPPTTLGRPPAPTLTTLGRRERPPGLEPVRFVGGLESVRSR
jgi:hypothetical protein